MTEEHSHKCMREIAALSAAHRLNGYDRNVLSQWASSGFAGRRPRLSFEFQVQWRRENEEAQAAERQEAAAHAALLKRIAEQKKEWEQKRLAEEQWRRDNPELAAAKDKERQRVSEERQRAIEEKLSMEQLERKGHDRRERIISTVTSRGPEHLDADEFVEWCEEIATEEQLATYEKACLKRARSMGERKGGYPVFLQFGKWLYDVFWKD